MSSASNANIFQICRKLCVLVPAVLSFFCCARAEGAEPAKVLEGSVILVSTLPAIDKLAYADCDYVVVLAVNTAGAGENRLAVVVPGIRKYKKVGSSSLFRVGKKYRLTLKDASALPEERRRIQISDDNENFDLQYLYLEDAREIGQFSGIFEMPGRSLKTGGGKLIGTAQDDAVRTKFIQEESVRLNDVLNGFDHEESKKILAFLQGKLTRYPQYVFEACPDGEKVYTLFDTYAMNSFPNIERELTAPSEAHRENLLKAIVAIQKFMAARGCRLYVVPVPKNTELYLDNFLPQFKKLSTYSLLRTTFMRDLLENGVEVIDILPYCRKTKGENFYWHQSYCYNSHLSSYGNYQLATFLYNHLARYSFASELCGDKPVAQVDISSAPVVYNGKTIGTALTASVSPEKGSDGLPSGAKIQVCGDSFASDQISFLQMLFRSRVSPLINYSGAAVMGRTLLVRERELPSEPKVCFFIFYSHFLLNPWVVMPERKSGSEVILNNPGGKPYRLSFDAKTDLTDKGYPFLKRFTVAIPPGLLKEDGKYLLKFYITGKNVLYTIQVDNNEQSGHDGSGHDIIFFEGQMPKNKESVACSVVLRPSSAKDIEFSLEKITISVDDPANPH